MVAWLALSALYLATPALAADTPTAASTPDPGLLALRDLDRRLEVIGFRLATANAALCPRRQLWSGLVLHDAGEYERGYRAAAAATFALDGNRPAVLAVATASPAGAAGIAEDMTLTALNGAPLTPPPLPPRATSDGTDAATAALNAALNAGPARLTLRAGAAGAERAVTLTGIPGCASQVDIDPGDGLSAKADGEHVAVTGALAEFVASNDELAVIVGHEMAHNILGHRARLATEHVSHGIFASLGANAAKIRATEEEADYLGLYLAARAGYNIAAASSLWTRLSRATGGELLASATHPSWRHRQQMVAATIAEIAATRAGGGALLPEPARFAAPVAAGDSPPGPSH